MIMSLTLLGMHRGMTRKNIVYNNELPVVTKDNILHPGFCTVYGCCAVRARKLCFHPDSFNLIGAKGLNHN